MQRQFLFVLLSALTLFGFPNSLPGHHSQWAEFDQTKPITLTGVVTKIEWMNPHARFVVDVRNTKTGKTSAWFFQLSSPNTLAKLGWTRDSLKAGDIVTVSGAVSREHWSSALAAEIWFEDGHRLFGTPSTAVEKP